MITAGLPLAAQVVISNQVNYQGTSVPFASIRVCVVTSTGTPCNPTAQLYADYNLTIPVSQPAAADQYGNYTFYAANLPAPSFYTVQVTPVVGLTWSYVVGGNPILTIKAGGLNTQTQYNCNGVLCGSLATLDAAGNFNTPGDITAASATISGAATAGSYTTPGTVAAGQGIVNGPLTAKQIAAQPMCDMYSSLATCLQALPSYGGRALAWGVTGAQSISANPFTGLTALGGKLQLGAAAITSSAEITLKNAFVLEGVNRGGQTLNTDLVQSLTRQVACQIASITDSGSTKTITTTGACTINAGDAFTMKGTETCDGGAFVAAVTDSTHFTFLNGTGATCASTTGWVRIPFVNLGDTTFSFGTMMKDLSVDCQNVPGSIGVYSDSIQELSGLDRVSIRNCEIPVLFEKGTSPTGSGTSVANIDLTRLEVSQLIQTTPIPLAQNLDLSGVSVAVTGDGTAMSLATVDLGIALPGASATPGQWAYAYSGDVIHLKGCTGDTAPYLNHLTFMVDQVINGATTKLTFALAPLAAGLNLTGCTLSHGVGVFFRSGGGFIRGIKNMTVDAGTSTVVATTGNWVSPGHIAAGLITDAIGNFDQIHVEYAQDGVACGVTTQCIGVGMDKINVIAVDNAVQLNDIVLPVGGTPIEEQPLYVSIGEVSMDSGSTCVIFDKKHGGCLSTHANGWQGAPFTIGLPPGSSLPSQVQQLSDVVCRKNSDCSWIVQDATGVEQGRLRVNFTSHSAILSSNGGTTYIRPNGDQNTVGQVAVDTSGNTTATQFTGPLIGTATNVTGVVAVAHGGTNHTISGLLCQSGAQGAITGNGAAQTVYSCVIPAGALGIGECGRVEVYFAHTGSASVVYQWVYGGTTMTFGGSPSASNYMKEQILICNGAGVQNAQQLIPDQILSGTGIAAVLAPATAAENTVNATTLNFTFNVASPDAVTPRYMIGYRLPGY